MTDELLSAGCTAALVLTAQIQVARNDRCDTRVYWFGFGDGGGDDFGRSDGDGRRRDGETDLVVRGRRDRNERT